MEVCGVDFAADFNTENPKKSGKKRENQKRNVDEHEKGSEIMPKCPQNAKIRMYKGKFAAGKV